MIKMVVATRNRKKLKEIKEILNGLELKISSISDYPHPPRVIENGKTFKENAAKKAVALSRFTGILTLGEDSGLCVDSLKGKPGIYSSRYAGRDKSDAKNNKKLLTALAGLPLKKRSAHYICAVAMADKRGLISVVEGRCNGIIGFAPKGNKGFGYDPIFLIPKFKKTFAELGEGIKHKMSHRYHALRKARKIIDKYIEGHSTR